MYRGMTSHAPLEVVSRGMHSKDSRMTYLGIIQRKIKLIISLWPMLSNPE